MQEGVLSGLKMRGVGGGIASGDSLTNIVSSTLLLKIQ